MNLLFRVLYAHGCRSTHHKLAMDSLCHLRGPRAEWWQNLFLKYHEDYLEGAKVPDTKFKDFRNHVLHVRDDFWGGAPASARQWYSQTVASLRIDDWQTAIYNAGVLSHYYTDPLMPFHTQQSEAENNIHRATEWSITKSYEAIREQLEFGAGYPHIEAPTGPDWLEEMVRNGARLSNPHYETLIREYDFGRGVKDPPAGLNNVSRELLSKVIGHAIVGYARILERAFEESAAAPPVVNVSLEGFVATLKIPIQWISNKLADMKERQVVEAMYHELQATGKVEATLPEDDRMVRELHQKEVVAPKANQRTAAPAVMGDTDAEARGRKIASCGLDVFEASVPDPARQVKNLSPRAIAEIAHSQLEAPKVEAPKEPANPKPAPVADVAVAKMTPAAERAFKFYLDVDSPVADGPSIGPKMERKLNAAGVTTVADLLARNAVELAAKLDMRSITAQTITDWQDQARLACQIPQIRGHDAQILVACGFRTPESVARANANELLEATDRFVVTSEGQRIIRGGKAPDLEEINDWIRWAGQARVLKAA